MDIGKLSPGERIIAGAGGLLFVDSFLPWFRFGRAHATRGAWDNALSALAILIALAMVIQIAVMHFSTLESNAPGKLTWGQTHLFASFAVLALVVLQFLAGDRTFHYPWQRTFGMYVGLVCAAGLAYGGMVRSREPDPTSEGDA